MRSLRALALALAVAAIAWGAVVVFANDEGDDEPIERPDRLVEVPFGSLDRITVVDQPSGRRGVLERSGERLRVGEGEKIAAVELEALREDLFPLLAIRTLDEARPEFGLDDPRLEVEIVSEDGTSTRLEVGAPNFDATGAYVRVDGTIGLVLPSVVNTLAAVAGSEPVVPVA